MGGFFNPAGTRHYHEAARNNNDQPKKMRDTWALLTATDEGRVNH